MKQLSWINLPIFISSTFRDMNAERDLLVKEVFPELQEWCEQRHLRLFEIDLRWGITVEEAFSKRTVYTCLKGIDESRPFFLCFLGQRRGWVPDKSDISDETFGTYPGLSTRVPSHSVTEMEIEHALLEPMETIVNNDHFFPEPSKRVLFCLRDESYLPTVPDNVRSIYKDDSESWEAICAFRSRVRSGGFPCLDYSCRYDEHSGALTDFETDRELLRDVLLRRLKSLIQDEFPDRLPQQLSVSEEEDMRQRERIWDGESNYIPQEESLSRLREYVRGSDVSTLLVSAPSGVGKSTLISAFTRECLQAGLNIRTVFCGISDESADLYHVLESLLRDFSASFPPTLEQALDSLPHLLSGLGDEQPLILILDGINEADESGQLIRRLPAVLPENLKLILSCREGSLDEKLIQSAILSHTLIKYEMPATYQDDYKRRLIDSFLSGYLKSLDEQTIHQICLTKGSDNPLFLKVLLSELRISGRFDTLNEQIARYGDTAVQAFNELLRRMEADDEANAGCGSSKTFFALIAASRSGLSEDEAVKAASVMTGLSEAQLCGSFRICVRQQRAFLTRKNGAVNFLPESFRIAASEKYSEDLKRCHAVLCGIFSDELDHPAARRRACLELPYHLAGAGRTAQLQTLLTDWTWIDRKLRCCGLPSLLADYRLLPVRDKACALLEETLRLSSNAVSRDPGTLSFQLQARLRRYRSEERIDLLLADAESKGTDPGSYHLTPLRGLAQPGEEQCNFSVSAAAVTAVCKYGEMLAACAEDGTFVLYSPASGIEISRMHLGGTAPTALCSDGVRIFAGHEDGSLSLIIPETGYQERKELAHRKGITSLAISGNRLYSAGKDGRIRIWHAETLRGAGWKKLCGRCVCSVKETSGRLLYGGRGEAVVIRGKLLRRYALTKRGYVKALDAEGDHAAAVTFYPAVMFIDLKTGKVTRYNYTDPVLEDDRLDVPSYIQKGSYMRDICAAGPYFAAATPTDIALYPKEGAAKPEKLIHTVDPRCLMYEDGVIYVGTGQGRVIGQRLDSENREENGNPVLGVGIIGDKVASLNRHSMMLFDTKAQDQLARIYPLVGREYASLGVSKDTFYIGTVNYTIYSCRASDGEWSVWQNDHRIGIYIQSMPNWHITAFFGGHYREGSPCYLEQCGELHGLGTNITLSNFPGLINSAALSSDQRFLAIFAGEEKPRLYLADLENEKKCVQQELPGIEPISSLCWENRDEKDALLIGSVDGTVSRWLVSENGALRRSRFDHGPALFCGMAVLSLVSSDDALCCGLRGGGLVIFRSGDPEPVYMADCDADVTFLDLFGGLLSAGCSNGSTVICSIHDGERPEEPVTLPSPSRSLPDRSGAEDKAKTGISIRERLEKENDKQTAGKKKVRQIRGSAGKKRAGECIDHAAPGTFHPPADPCSL